MAGTGKGYCPPDGYDQQSLFRHYQCYERRFGFECGPDQLRMDVPAPGIDPSSPNWLTYIIVFVVLDFAGYVVHAIDHKVNFFGTVIWYTIAVKNSTWPVRCGKVFLFCQAVCDTPPACSPAGYRSEGGGHHRTVAFICTILVSHAISIPWDSWRISL